MNTNASPVIPDGSGASQARALCQVTDDWSVQNAIVGQVFDTTASNTGRHKGASSRLEVLPSRPVMWLACRHHVGELHVVWVYSACRGPELTKSPENQLFKRFHASWPNLNTAPNSLALWAWPANQHDWRFQHAESILLWAREMMLNGTFRQRDHREFDSGLSWWRCSTSLFWWPSTSNWFPNAKTRIHQPNPFNGHCTT